MPHTVHGARPTPASPAFAKTVWALALQAGLGGCLATTAVQAQPLPAVAAAQRFDLPAAPLDRALNPFATQAGILLRDAPHVLIKGGHGEGDRVANSWFSSGGQRDWTWPRLRGEFHGSGCTLASAIAARLALQVPMEAALDTAQHYTQRTLASAFSIAPGQQIPDRVKEMS